MNAPSVIVVILAYGLWGTSRRSPKKIVGYGMYLKECENALHYLAVCGYDVNVILCGGATADGITEAESMRGYFAHLGAEEDLELTIYKEDRSLTTPANIWQAFEYIKSFITSRKHIQQLVQNPNNHCSLLFICDLAREFKVKWLVNRLQREKELCVISEDQVFEIYDDVYLYTFKSIEVLGINRPDVTPKSTKIFQFFETLVMMLVPWILRKRIQKLRKE